MNFLVCWENKILIGQTRKLWPIKLSFSEFSTGFDIANQRMRYQIAIQYTYCFEYGWLYGVKLSNPCKEGILIENSVLDVKMYESYLKACSHPFQSPLWANTKTLLMVTSKGTSLPSSSIRSMVFARFIPGRSPKLKKRTIIRITICNVNFKYQRCS